MSYVYDAFGQLAAEYNTFAGSFACATCYVTANGLGSVDILIGGVLNGTAILGGDRSDVCAHYPSGGGCPNVGWNYELNTTTFANGTRTFGARATSADGNQYTVSSAFNAANQP